MLSLNLAINRLAQELLSLSEVDREVATDIVSGLVDLVEISRNSNDNEFSSNELRAIQKYIEKRISRIHPTVSLEPNIRSPLGMLRNELAHGSARRKYDISDIKRLAPVFWKVLEKSAVHWHSFELLNILDYCLGSHINPIKYPSLDPKNLVRIYKAHFDGLDEYQKIVAFHELILRFRYEPAFKNTLDSLLFT